MKLTVFILVLTFFVSTSVGAKTELVFGIVPQQSATTLAKNWGPLLKEISERSGISIKFATAKDIPTFEKRLLEQTYDIAYMNPYHYVVVSQQPGYQALARQRDKKIKGIIVVPKSSSSTSLADLANQTIVFPAPAAFAATIIPQAVFRQANIGITPKYVFSHDSVYMNVARGFAPAGGGVIRTFRGTPKAISNELRILWQSDGYTPHAIATKPSIPPEIRNKLLTAMLSLNDQTEVAPLLAAINFKGFVAANDQDWDDVRALNIQTRLAE